MDKLILATAMLILGIGIGGFYYFADQAEWIRIASLLGAGVIAVAVAMQSAQGQMAWEFAKSSRIELRKVVWPTNKETMQMTLVVLIVVVIIALFLWIVDWGLLKAVKALTGQRV